MNECSSNSMLFTQSREASQEFDCLLVAPSAHGLVRHCVALLELLRAHSINGALVSGPEAREVLSDIATSIPFIASREHSIDWKRSGGEGNGHVQQICRRDNLERLVRKEILLCERYKPRFLITKNVFSVPISAHACRIPFVTYHTGGALHFDLARNPLSRAEYSGLTQEVNYVEDIFGMKRSDRFPSSLLSPWLNLCRGTARSSQTEVSADTPSNLRFLGALNCDQSVASLSPPLPFDIYATLGTMIRSPEPFTALHHLLAHVKRKSLMTTVNVSPEVLPSAPNVQCVNYIPNSFAIPRSTLVIHHGGHGTMIEALAHGKPQLVIPQNTRSACQDLQGFNLQALGVGDVYFAKEESVESFALKVENLLSESTQKKASDFALQFQRDTKDGQDESIAALKRLLR